jgi:hypothetical protein
MANIYADNKCISHIFESPCAFLQFTSLEYFREGERYHVTRILC